MTVIRFIGQLLALCVCYFICLCYVAVVILLFPFVLVWLFRLDRMRLPPRAIAVIAAACFLPGCASTPKESHEYQFKQNGQWLNVYDDKTNWIGAAKSAG